VLIWGRLSHKHIRQQVRDSHEVEDDSADSRSADAKGSDLARMPLAPMNREDAPNADPEKAWECYQTPRAQYPTAPGWVDNLWHASALWIAWLLSRRCPVDAGPPFAPAANRSAIHY
jgi:hypothetical protein